MTPAPIAFVLHANQFVITDGYTDRDGLSTTAAGFDSILSLHVAMGVPAALHISGPMIEALAWHRPALLARLRKHLASGVISLIGGTYGENIMPLSTPRQNRRQLSAFHELAEGLLNVSREALRTAWVPERVWDTETCAPPLVDAAATGVAYRRVLLDDRLSFSLSKGRYEGSPRQVFDEHGPYDWPVDGYPASIRDSLSRRTLSPYRIADGQGLVGVPLNSHLRYLIPPHDPSHLDLLAELAEVASDDPAGSLLVFGDDLERVAGVAGWEPALDRYARFLRWLDRSGSLTPVGLDEWCDAHEPHTEAAIEPGTYYELAHLHGAGEDYRNWADDPRWEPYATTLRQAEAALDDADDGGFDPGLRRLAERLVMLGHHETAWQDPAEEGGRAPAPWAKATAAHAADAFPILAAAAWASDPERSGLHVQVTDIDSDGHDELIISNDHLFAVISPRWGGRLTLLVHRDTDPHGATHGTVVVGNHADHWNFQTELHKHMQQPANHPGAFGVRGTENHCHEVGRIHLTHEAAVVELIDVEPGKDRGLTKTVSLTSDGRAIVVCVRRPSLPGEMQTTVALSPDYQGLLEQGRTGVAVEQGRSWLAAHSLGGTAWVAHDPDESTGLLVGTSPRTGHAVVAAVDGCGYHRHLVIGTGSIDDTTGPALIRRADALLHPGPSFVGAGVGTGVRAIR